MGNPISTDTDVIPTTSESSVMTATSPSTNPSAESSPSPTSRQNIGAVVGGTMADVSAFVLATASLLCYRRYKKRIGGPSRVAEPVLVPFVSPRMAPTPIENGSLPIHQTPVGSHPTKVRKRTFHSI
ncbi:hypothetical protein JVT61DRAFT_8933 [Boletus reticuloceps]|uniref:Uncharacterized protein n=1 Tax=Boletus reticuloceps TaxID=495285 RepID=A0A8I2YH70_9AGAM|nr:hypothetical protein JVT61DRAFT_8933 [Boletus reticuloceps]